VEEPTKGKYKKDFSYTNQSFSSLPEDFHIRGSESDITSGNSKSAMGNNIFFLIKIVIIKISGIITE
jgi:hypothetical protein